MSTAALDDLGRRIERLTVDPDGISAPFSRLLRPLLYRIGWAPKTSIDELRALVAIVRTRTEQSSRGELADSSENPEPAALKKQLGHAMSELEKNLRRVERATVIVRRPLVSHASWLRRAYEIAVHAHRLLASVEAGRRLWHADDARAVAAVDESALLPPLVMKGVARLESESQSDAATGVYQRSGAVLAGEPENQSTPQIEPDTTRVLELQLDAIDHVLAAARDESDLLARRRRLLEVARQLLLETSAALALEDDGVQLRQRAIARQITRIDRMEALGLRGDVALLHQARTALSRGEWNQLHAAIQAMDRSVLSRGDNAAAALTGAATRGLAHIVSRQAGRAAAEPSRSDVRPGRRKVTKRRAVREARAAPVENPDHRAESLNTSFHETFGAEVADAIDAGYDEARSSSWRSGMLTELFRRYVAPGTERAMRTACLAVDGSCEVGGTLSPVRIREDHVRLTAVPFPTRDLVLLPAHSHEELPDAVIRDPRTVLLDLAAGRLLARRFIKPERQPATRTVMRGEVRVYVLDGSASMLGPRARMRDAILVAELATLMRRLSDQARTTRVVLYYRYFTHELGELYRVDSVEGAAQAIHQILATPRSGGTDIERALVSSLDKVREARDDDPDLARAQVVLITDGMAAIHDRRVEDARAALGTIDLGVSVIALGEHNRVLRQLVARQRRHGVRAFYHFFDDEYLGELVDGDIDDGPALHLPAVALVAAGHPDHAAGFREAIEAEIGPLLQELADLERDHNRDALRSRDRADRSRRMRSRDIDADIDTDRDIHSDMDTDIRTDIGFLPDDELAGEGRRASTDARNRDARALGHRFERWFPAPPPSEHAMVEAPEPGTLERDDLDSVIVLLATIAEVVELTEGSELGRRADALDLLERMLPDARLSPARYRAVLGRYPVLVAGPLDAVRSSARWGIMWRIEQPHRRPTHHPSLR